MDNIQWDKLFGQHVSGLKNYVLRDTKTNYTIANKRLTFLKIVHYFLKYSLIIYVFYKVVNFLYDYVQN